MVRFGGGMPASFDVERVVDLVRRIVRLDESVFVEIAGDDGLSTTGLVMPAVFMALSGVSTWLYLELHVRFDVDLVAVVTRQLLLATAVGYAAWLGWVLVAEAVLARGFGLSVDRRALARVMGFATLPLAALAIAFIPDLLHDADAFRPALPSLHFAVGMAALFAWFALSEHAMAGAVPTARRRHLTIANLAGFLVCAAVITVLATREGMGFGPWVHTAGTYRLGG